MAVFRMHRVHQAIQGFIGVLPHLSYPETFHQRIFVREVAAELAQSDRMVPMSCQHARLSFLY